MRRKLKTLVGRYVRLKKAAFEVVSRQVRKSGCVENFFVVSALTSGVDKLICYGSGIRVSVAPKDVILV